MPYASGKKRQTLCHEAVARWLGIIAQADIPTQVGNPKKRRGGGGEFGAPAGLPDDASVGVTLQNGWFLEAGDDAPDSHGIRYPAAEKAFHRHHGM